MRKYTYWYSDKPLSDGSMVARARMKNARITMWKQDDGYVMKFTRAAQKDDEHRPPSHVIEGRLRHTWMKLSSEAMAAVVALWMGFHDRVEVPFIREKQP